MVLNLNIFSLIIRSKSYYLYYLSRTHEACDTRELDFIGRLKELILPNVFGLGLCILHYGIIVARIGENCRMELCVNIGTSSGNPNTLRIDNNVYTAPGVKIYGNIQIGNNIAIRANSSVNKSFTEDGIMIAGSPTKKIKPIDIKRIIAHC